MRKINMMLVAAIAVSPLALASGGHQGGYDDLDLTIDGSGNFKYYKDVEINKSKSVTLDNVGNDDNDELSLENVGNTYTKHITDNSTSNDSFDFTLDKEINLYLSASELDGVVMDTSVAYGGACCKGASEIKVYHTNEMANSFTDAAGVNLSGQNVGNNSLVQQTSSTNASLAASH